MYSVSKWLQCSPLDFLPQLLQVCAPWLHPLLFEFCHPGEFYWEGLMDAMFPKFHPVEVGGPLCLSLDHLIGYTKLERHCSIVFRSRMLLLAAFWVIPLQTRCVPELEISDFWDNWLSRVLHTTLLTTLVENLFICKSEGQDSNINVNISFFS